MEPNVEPNKKMKSETWSGFNFDMRFSVADIFLTPLTKAFEDGLVPIFGMLGNEIEKLSDKATVEVNKVNDILSKVSTSFLGEFEEKHPDNRPGLIWEITNNMDELLLNAIGFVGDGLAKVLLGILKTVLDVFGHALGFLLDPVAWLIDYLFGWILVPLTHIFSSIYEFFLSLCFAWIIIQLIAGLVEIFSIAKIIAG